MTDRGWPRPKSEWADHRSRRGARGESYSLPVPWILEVSGSNEVRWTTFHDAWTLKDCGRLCQVCGLEMEGCILLGCERPGMTSGSGCHPRCMALSLKWCPHLVDRGVVVAYRYDGPGPGVYEPDPELSLAGLPEYEVLTTAVPYTSTDVVELARRNPLGRVGHLQSWVV